MAEILTKQQKLALKLLAQTDISANFYFSGGTALAHYYLQHRKSEDLDFFSEIEFDPQSITILIKDLREKLGFINFDYQNSFNRNLYFLHFSDGYILKLEFTYYPFTQVERPSKKDGLLVDSAVDIAANKLFTIAQNPRGRDYFDLFHLIHKYKYDVNDLRMRAKAKFDWHIDPLQLASKFFELEKHLDDPIIFGEMNRQEIINFFQNEAKKLGELIVR